jgi:hypothetical protein
MREPRARELKAVGRAKHRSAVLREAYGHQPPSMCCLKSHDKSLPRGRRQQKNLRRCGITSQWPFGNEYYISKAKFVKE